LEILNLFFLKQKVVDVIVTPANGAPPPEIPKDLKPDEDESNVVKAVR
jgi:hypothetical protein